MGIAKDKQTILFFRHSSSEKKTIFIVYVDDIIVTRDDNDEVVRLKKMLANEFEAKDLRRLKYFLRMEIV